MMHLMVGAEGEQVVTPLASCNAGGIIKSIRVSLGASHFEYAGIGSGLARIRVGKAPGAAEPGGVKCGACALARHHTLFVVRTHLETHRAHRVQIAHTTSIATFTCICDQGK